MHVRTTVVLERQGEPAFPRSGLSPNEVARELLELDGSRDVTVIVSPEGGDEHLMIAIDGSRAFLGLERSDGLLQFTVRNPDQERKTSPFTIGGQESEIETRYLTDLTTAAVVVEEWLEGGESSTQGYWERQ